MKRFCLVLTLLLSLPAFAAQTVLRCQIPWGELQEVTIKDHDGVLILTQLNNAGSFRSYPIDESSLVTGNIPLVVKWGTANLIKVRNNWTFQTDNGDYYVLSCR